MPIQHWKAFLFISCKHLIIVVDFSYIIVIIGKCSSVNLPIITMKISNQFMAQAYWLSNSHISGMSVLTLIAKQY